MPQFMFCLWECLTQNLEALGPSKTSVFTCRQPRRLEHSTTQQAESHLFDVSNNLKGSEAVYSIQLRLHATTTQSTLPSV
jgi:hypothetical protein